MQKRLNSSNSNGIDDKAAHLAEVGRLQGALQQAGAEFKQLLEQCNRRQEQGDSSQGRMSLTELQASNKVLTQHLAKSHQQVVHSQQCLQQSREQVQRYVQETSKLQQLVEKLSKAVVDMHGAVEKADCLRQKQSILSTHINNSNLQAVHDAVQRNLSRYESTSSECTFASSDILLPALWKPERERHIAPSGFR